MRDIDLTESKDVLGEYAKEDYTEVIQKYNDPGTRYAFSVLDGQQQAGYRMQLACFRHVQDLKRLLEGVSGFPYHYDLKKVAGILNFAKICPDVDAGKPLPLMPWQKFILCQSMGWRDKFEDKRFTEIYVSVGRKQGKTYFAAILSSYSFLVEGHGLYNQDFLVASNTADQTTKLFGYVSGMVSYLIENEKPFIKIAKNSHIEVQANRIIAKKFTNRLVKISNKSGKFDSYHFTNAIYDEAGDEKAGRYTSRIVTGQGDVPNHQFIKISTAYEFLNTEFFNDIKRSVETMEKDYERSNENELCLVWSQDDESEVYKPDTWIKSNPLIGLPGQKEKKIASLITIRESLANKGKMAEFQNKNMNIYLKTSTASFVKLDDVEKAVISDFNVNGRQVYIGFDYSMLSDNTALAFVYPYQDSKNRQRWFIYQHSFIPWHNAGSIDAKEKQDGVNYRDLAQQGFCTITSHKQGLINDDQVYQWLLNYVERHNLQVVFFGYDSMGVTAMIKQLELNTSWPLEAVRQRTGELKDPTKFTQRGFIEGSIKRFDDKIMEKALLNAELYEDKVGIQVDKAKATLKIDVVDAIINAIYQAQYHFEDFADVNDPDKQVDRMTDEQVLNWFNDPKSGLLGGDDNDI